MQCTCSDVAVYCLPKAHHYDLKGWGRKIHVCVNFWPFENLKQRHRVALNLAAPSPYVEFQEVGMTARNKWMTLSATVTRTRGSDVSETHILSGDLI